ncbi:MAG: DUF502 domain-containing protein [Hymenobacteraceae bacterium]|nr:DUF502 domain-containing protein [Hymenobacteraceae bacterium]
MLRRLIRYFFRGLLLVGPATLTIYLLMLAIGWLNATFDVGIPGAGAGGVLIGLTALGWVGSSGAVRPLFQQVEKLIYPIPVIGLFYTSTRDLFDALVGDNSKFNRPVLIRLTDNDASTTEDGYQIGFVTQESLAYLNLPDMAAVYVPSAYQFSGDVLLLPRQRITYLNASATELMKFVVSGGVARLGE